MYLKVLKLTNRCDLIILMVQTPPPQQTGIWGETAVMC